MSTDNITRHGKLAPNKKFFSFGIDRDIITVAEREAKERTEKERREVSVSEVMRDWALAEANKTLEAKGEAKLDINVRSDAWRTTTGAKLRGQNRAAKNGANVAEVAAAVVQALIQSGVIPTQKQEAAKRIADAA